ncbi:MAG TPA: hypothetical protein VKB75_07025, partial [Jatrophihabitans sp.]|nr:hypothetical protein [Jatrophihabitans sp.]
MTSAAHIDYLPQINCGSRSKFDQDPQLINEVGSNEAETTRLDQIRACGLPRVINRPPRSYINATRLLINETQPTRLLINETQRNASLDQRDAAQASTPPGPRRP